MKNLLIGMIIGILLTAGAGYFLISEIKKTEYDNGYNAGEKKGIATGTTAGIAKGIADLRAEQQRVQDSIASAEKEKERVRKAAANKHKVVPKPVQNWHVIDGKIAEPVKDMPPAKPE